MISNISGDTSEGSTFRVRVGGRRLVWVNLPMNCDTFSHSVISLFVLFVGLTTDTQLSLTLGKTGLNKFLNCPKTVLMTSRIRLIREHPEMEERIDKPP